MPDPTFVQQVVKPSAQKLIRGGFSMIVDEVRGHYRRKGEPQAEFHINEYGPLPDLDSARLGDSLAPGEAIPATDMPDDLFGPIVGMEYETRVLKRCVMSEVPLHALVIGDPGTGKSLLLEELHRLPDTRFVVGRNMTPSGLIEMMVDQDEPPRILLIEEIDKSDPTTLATLLTVMDGKATRAVTANPPWSATSMFASSRLGTRPRRCRGRYGADLSSCRCLRKPSSSAAM